jgi:long-chain acyl-CoA synthetase
MDPSRIAEATTVGVFFRQVIRQGDRDSLHYHDGSSWRIVSWRQLGGLVLRVAANLVAEGVGPGDRVALMAENCVEWLYCDFGIQAAGAVPVPIYPNMATTEASAIAANCEAVLGIASSPKLGERLGSLRTVSMDKEVAQWLAREPSGQHVAEVEARCASLQPDDLCTIVYTSGTSGQPKGVMLSHRNFVTVGQSCLEAFALSPQDRALSLLPYSHVLERVNSIFVGLVMAGMTGWLCRGRNRLLDDLQECRPTVMVSVPRIYEKIYQALLAHVRTQPRHRQLLFHWALGAGRRRHVQHRRALAYPIADRLVLEPVRRRLTGGNLRFFITGGAAITREVEEFFWALGIKILQGWGMTETSSAATANTLAFHRFETVGRPLPGVEVRAEGDGEILVRGPGNMLGYFHNPEETSATLVDGWLRTGDIGELDADGFLRITDRKKDLIKTSGGKFVAPQLLETRLQQDALIERVVVIGDLRPYVTALVVPDWKVVRNELQVTGYPAELASDRRVRAAIQTRIDKLNQTLGNWETIKRFALLPEDLTEERGELTPTLKVRRKNTEARYADLIATLYESPSHMAREERI